MYFLEIHINVGVIIMYSLEIQLDSHVVSVMEDQALKRYVPEHPLPQEIQEMKKDDTVCQFCGVSYLIHNEMKALEERVKEAERQMEYYKGSVEREEKLKIKVASMEEESDKLSRALQASEERYYLYLMSCKHCMRFLLSLKESSLLYM